MAHRRLVGLLAVLLLFAGCTSSQPSSEDDGPDAPAPGGEDRRASNPFEHVHLTGNYSMVRIEGNVTLVDEHGKGPRFACGATLIHYQAWSSNRTLLIDHEAPKSGTQLLTPDALEKAHAAVEVTGHIVSSCATPRLVLLDPGNETLPLQLGIPGAIHEIGVTVSNRTVTLPSNATLQVGQTATVDVNATLVCGDRCHGSADHGSHEVHLDGSLTVEHLGLWSKEDIAWGPMHRVG